MDFRLQYFSMVGLGLAALTVANAPRPGQAAAPQVRDSGGSSLVLPSGNREAGVLLIEVAGPGEAPVGRSYDYRIKIANVSKNLMLEDVSIEQTKAKGLSIEKSDPEFKNGDDGAACWEFSKLAPGESRTIAVTAQGDEEGEVASCFRADYKSSLCLTTKFVKADLKVVKSAPEQADLCEVLVYRYTVTNTGSAVAKNVKLRDELDEGLTGPDGKTTQEFEVGDLKPGESRELAAKIQAARTGDFASRAVAEGAADLKANSNRPSTSIRRSKLAVNITGPSSMYVNQPMTYQVEVKNEGKIAARSTVLQVEADRSAKLLRTSKSEPGAVAPKISGNMLGWNLGDIGPGRTVTVSMTAIGRDETVLKHVATAKSACAREGDAARTATATRTVETEILTFPALLLSLVDRVDPVRVGDIEIYRVTVMNQGTGDDHNVEVKCTLPDQFTFVKAEGTTKAKSEGQTVTLGPIETLSARRQVVWDLHVKANAPGDVRTKAELTSDYLSDSRPAISIEPTRIIGSATSADVDKSKEEASGEDKEGDSEDQE